MQTYRLDVSYDGSGFRGYAAQEGLRTVQGELDDALATLLGEKVDTSVAGRTDAGVHARGQVVSFEWGEEIDAARMARSLNGIVGPEIAVTDARETFKGFNARFSALWRRYRYRIDPRPAPDPLTRHVTWHVGKELNLDSMKRVGSAFLGEHDFSSFCRSAESGGNVRRVDEAGWARSDDVLVFTIRANAFCHQMVRSLVGYSYDAGRGFVDPSSVEEVIAARDRSAVATVAPPHGLILWEVGYDP